MLRRCSILALFVVGCLSLPACVARSEVISSDLNVASGAKFSVGDFSLAASATADASDAKAEKIRSNYDRYGSHLGASFSKHLKRRDLDGGDQAVTASVEQFSSGNRWLRWVWPYTRVAWAVATVRFDCGSSGSFTVEGTQKGGWWMGGNPSTLFRSIGKRAAKHMDQSAE